MTLILVAAPATTLDRLADPCERCGAAALEECEAWCVLHTDGVCACGEQASLSASLREAELICELCALGLDPALAA